MDTSDTATLIASRVTEICSALLLAYPHRAGSATILRTMLPKSRRVKSLSASRSH
jgi:hypothetical protein